MLQDKWTSAYDCKTVLLSVQSLLGGLALFTLWPVLLKLSSPAWCMQLMFAFYCFCLPDPNNESPLNNYAASLWSNQEGILVSIIIYIWHLLEILHKNHGTWISISSRECLYFTMVINIMCERRTVCVVLFNFLSLCFSFDAEYKKVVHKQYVSGEVPHNWSTF